MENKKKLPWARFGSESVLIIVSILAALGIDSWLSARQLAAEERLLLEQLKTEFELNSQHLNERRGQQEELIQAARKLLDITGPESADSRYDIDSIEEDMFSLVIWWTYDPQMGRNVPGTKRLDGYLGYAGQVSRDDCDRDRRLGGSGDLA